MNSITNLLDLEDTDIEITDIQIQGQTKTLTLSTPPVPHFCPSCGFRMYSLNITVQMYPCSEGTDTGSPAL